MNFPTIEKFAIYLAFEWLVHCYCFEFDQKYFGVHFSPYVKPFSDKAGEEYTYNDIKTMATIATQKFSKLVVRGNFVYHDYYMPNLTYYDGSYASIYTGTIIALRNKANNNRSVSIMYQIWGTATVQQAESKIYVAIEAAEKANNIFPGTVEGISLWGHGDLQQTLNQLRTFRSQASALGIKLGAEQDCHAFRQRENKTFYNILRNIVQSADFIICSARVMSPSRRAEKTWVTVRTSFMLFKDLISQINSSVEVIGRTMWSSSGSKVENVENLRKYWQVANNWAAENQYRIYLSEAFDAPNRNLESSRHWGWWKLKANSETDSVDGYVEKISEQKSSTTTSSTPTKENNITTGHEEKIVNDDSSQLDETSYIVFVAGTAAATIGGIFLVSAAGLLLYCRRRKDQPTADVMSAQEIRDFMLGTINEANACVLKGNATAMDNAIKFPYDNSLEISKENLKIDYQHKLGSGQFGNVYKAIVDVSGAEAVDVALKVAKENCQLTALKGLMSEIKIMTYLGKHPNIVTLKGAYTAELCKGCVYVATELCNLGSLQSFLRKNQSRALEYNAASNSKFEKSKEIQLMELGTCSGVTFRDMVRWSLEIATGMEYIEQRQVVHADLATRNVLLSADKTVKISDFGLSRRMYNYMNYVKKNREPLPWRWMAVESLKRMEFSSKSDVWSYGVTLWEIFSKGDTPYPGLSWNQGFVGQLESGLRPNCPKFSSPEIYNIMCDCWNFEPSERPTFTELVECMESLLPKPHDEELVPGKDVYTSME